MNEYDQFRALLSRKNDPKARNWDINWGKIESHPYDQSCDYCLNGFIELLYFHVQFSVYQLLKSIEVKNSHPW